MSSFSSSSSLIKSNPTRDKIVSKEGKEEKEKEK